MFFRAAIIIVIITLSAVGFVNQNQFVHLQNAADLFNTGKPHAASKAVSAAIKSDPSNVDIYTTSILLLSDNENYKDAALIGDSLLKRLKDGKLNHKPTREELARIYVLLGTTYQELPDPERADFFYKSALALAPNSPALLNILGWFYADTGVKLDDAIRLTKRAAKLAPDDGNIIDSLGWALYKQGRIASALSKLQQAAALQPDSSEVRYHLGAAYAKAKMRTEARIELKKALIIDINMTAASKLLKTIQRNNY